MRLKRDLAIRLFAYLGLGIAAFTGLEVGIRMAADAAGAWGIIAASALFPATIAGAPLLALATGQWVPVIVVYGGGLTAGMLCARHSDSASVPGASATS